MQAPELVDDKVHATEDDLSTQLHLLNIVGVKDETHLKHNESVRKRPLPGTPPVGSIFSGNTDQCITHRESEG
jgi:hypothetical protein